MSSLQRIPSPFKAVLFDLGSTLIYYDATWSSTLQESALALTRSLRASGLDLDEDTFPQLFSARMRSYYNERATEFIEYTTHSILSALLAEMSLDGVPDERLRQALAAMYAVTQKHWQTEADAIATLQALQGQGYRLGLISNAGDDADVQVLIDKAGVRSFFDVILVSAAVGIRKPNPEIFHMALRHWGFAPHEVVMVGDTLGADVLGAQNAGVSSVWITRRADTPENHSHEDTICPDAVITDLDELPGLLARWSQPRSTGC